MFMYRINYLCFTETILRDLTRLYVVCNELLLVLFDYDSRGILLNLPPIRNSNDPRPILHVTGCQRSPFSFAPFHKYKKHPHYYIMAIKSSFVKLKPGQVNDKYMSKPVGKGASLS